MSVRLANTIRQFSLGMPSARPEILKSYEEAVCTLNTLQSNAATLARSVAERDRGRHLSIPETIQHAKRAGVMLEDINRLSMIHVSGTKGKGSTCAFCESILRAQGYKTGFFSSPHLVEVRERIRINGKPLSKEAFSTYFWDCYKKLDDTKTSTDGTMPQYFRFLTIMAFHTFLAEKVDVAIIEVGIGGQYDCTNIISHPVVCGVSSLGMDHTQILGDTIDKIAWQKAGIIKHGVPAFTVPQPEQSIEVIRKRAQDLRSPLWIVPELDDYTFSGTEQHNEPPRLGIPGEMQHQNASLALQLCRTWLRDHQKDVSERTSEYAITAQKQQEKSSSAFSLSTTSPEEAIETAAGFTVDEQMFASLRGTRWPGRSQILRRPAEQRLTYYIDGAHTPRSMEACANWFKEAADEEASNIEGKVLRVLLFNTTGERQSDTLLQYLTSCNFDAAAFCPNIANRTDNTRKADQVNYMVTTDTQLNKCEENRNSWLSLLLRNDQIAIATEKTTIKASQNGSGAAGTTENMLENNETNPGQCTDSSSMPAHTFSSINSALLWCTQQRETELTLGGANSPAFPNDMQDPVHIQVLCTGSLHLVGGVLGLIDSSLEESMK